MMSRSRHLSQRHPRWAAKGAARWWLAAGLLLVAPTLLAQTTLAQTASDSAAESTVATSGGVDEEIDVHIVEIEVRVLDRRGRPLSGLGREDFRLAVAGREMPIETFDEVGGLPGDPGASARLPASGELAADPNELLFVVLYVDQRFLEPGDLDKLREPLGSFVEGLPPEVRIMLVLAGEDYRILEPFTDDRQRILRRLPELEGRPGGSQLARQYRRLLDQLQRQRQEDGFRQADLIGPATVRTSRGEPRILLAEIEAFDLDSEHALGASGRELDRLLNALGGLPGRKQLIYVGQRLPTGAAARLLSTWQRTFQRRSDEPGQTASESARLDDGSMDAVASGRGGHSAADLFEALARRAAASEVVFHAVTTSGGRRAARLSTTVDVSLGPSSADNPSQAGLVADDTLADLDGLRILADRTGGRYHGGGRGFDDFFGGIRTDLGTFYRLGWSAVAGDWQVEVQLAEKRRRTTVLHSDIARVRSRDQVQADRTVAALTLARGFDNPLAVSLEVGVPVADGEQWVVPITVRVPVAELALFADGTAHAGRLAIYATAGGFDIGVTPVTKAVIPVRIRNSDLLTALGRRVDYQAEIPIPTPRGRVAITVRDDLRPRSATVVAEVVKPPVPSLGGSR